MELRTIKVKATLVRASKFDVFTSDEMPKENKLLFFRDPITHEFRDVYRISGTDSYDIVELYKGLQMGVFYRLTDQHHDSDFCFKLVLRTAELIDLFDTPKWIKQNVIYYELQGADSILGPLNIDQFSDSAKIQRLAAEGKIFVPGKQLFEPFKIKKSA